MSRDLLLGPYRVLDLTDGRGLLCGRILADLGADVVQVEPPGGSIARSVGPFYKDRVHPERSLYWWAYATNKRGIILNMESVAGRRLLRRLVEGAHFLIESFDPGYLDGLGLGYGDLAAIKPGLVMVSITPFGQDGPYAHYAAPDIVGMAMAGITHLTGDGDRPPVRVGFPQFYLHGAAAGAAGAMIAHTHRASTGQGQHVDVSCQQAVARALAHAPQSWDLEGVVLRRMGIYRQTSAETSVRHTWQCKDGYANYQPQGGAVARSTRALLDWMEEEGHDVAELKAVNWDELGYGRVPADVMDKSVVAMEKFFATRTREELTQAAVERRIMLFPVATQGDILAHPQLAARGYFTELAVPEASGMVPHPGVTVRDEGYRVGLERPAPAIGEHNEEIYRGELGLSPGDLTALRRWGAI